MDSIVWEIASRKKVNASKGPQLQEEQRRTHNCATRNSTMINVKTADNNVESKLISLPKKKTIKEY